MLRARHTVAQTARSLSPSVARSFTLALALPPVRRLAGSQGHPPGNVPMPPMQDELSRPTSQSSKTRLPSPLSLLRLAIFVHALTRCCCYLARTPPLPKTILIRSTQSHRPAAAIELFRAAVANTLRLFSYSLLAFSLNFYIFRTVFVSSVITATVFFFTSLGWLFYTFS